MKFLWLAENLQTFNHNVYSNLNVKQNVCSLILNSTWWMVPLNRLVASYVHDD